MYVLCDDCRMCTPGYGITLDRFMRIAHLLPRQRGNVAVDNYTFVNALLWMCRTGAPWRDLPDCYGKWITVYQRFNRWSRNGAIERLSAALQEERIIAVEVRVPAMDSTSVKVHQHAGRRDPPVGRIVRPGAGRAAQEEPHGPMGLRQAGVQGAEHGRTRLSTA